jgi:secondary thiamine-phosphate synthase enzyme
MICELEMPSGVAGLRRARGGYAVSIYTDRAPAFYDITDEVADAVTESGLRDGMVLVFSRHTTAAIKINEHEPLLIEDMEDFLTRFAPPDDYYQHNDFDVRTANMTPDEQPNGHAHCQQLLLSTSETIPITDGKLDLGTWQRIFLVELDRPRPREVLIKLIGA